MLIKLTFLPKRGAVTPAHGLLALYARKLATNDLFISDRRQSIPSTTVGGFPICQRYVFPWVNEQNLLP